MIFSIYLIQNFHCNCKVLCQKMKCAERERERCVQKYVSTSVFFAIVKIYAWHGIMNLKIANVLKSIHACIAFIRRCIMEKHVKTSIVFFTWIYILLNCRLALMKTIIRIHNKNSAYRQICVVFIVKMVLFPIFSCFLTKCPTREGNPREDKKKYWYIHVYMHFTYLYFWGSMFLDFYQL